MAWDTELVTIFRLMIDDDIEPFKYSDETVPQLILVGAQFAKSENIFDTDYTVSVENFILKPDPTKSDSRDDSFINLTLLRSACSLASAPLIKLKGRGLKVLEGPYQFDDRGAVEGTKLAAQSFCQAYTDAKWQFATSGGIVGEVIIGPYRSLLTRYCPREDREW